MRRNLGSGSIGSCGFIEGGAVLAEEVVELLLIQGIHGSGRSKGVRERVRGGGAEDLVELSDVNAVQWEVWVLAELLSKALGFHEGDGHWRCGSSLALKLEGGNDGVGGPLDDRVNVIQKRLSKNSIVSRELRCNKRRFVQITVGEVDGHY